MKKTFSPGCGIVIAALCTLFLVSCGKKDTDVPEPKIITGTAKLSGRLIDYTPQNDDKNKLTIVLSYASVITGEFIALNTGLEDDNSFSFEIPVDRDILLGVISIENKDYYLFTGAVSLSTNTETRVDFRSNEKGAFKASLQGFGYLTDVDMNHFSKAMQNVLVQGREPVNVDTLNKDEFVRWTLNDIDERFQVLRNDSLLSPTAKTGLENDLIMLYLHINFFDYASRERQKIADREDGSAELLPSERLDRSFYKFLRNFNLNDPTYMLLGYYYTEVLQDLLKLDELAIPDIAETPVAEWVKGVKATLSDLVGFSEGTFYDLLATNYYARQFTMSTRPLSEKQISNIKEYFRGDKSAFADILIRRSGEIEKLATGVGELNINDVSEIPAEQLLDVIISKHKGKVVLMDFWATWCGPCLLAMNDMKSMKSELKDKNIVYVYLTGSSPKEQWNERIPGIGGEHYYLNGDQWVYLMDSFGFDGIPSYAVYGRDGKLKHKFTGYPGNAEMRNLIEELL